MRKIITVILSLALIFAAAGCGSPAEEQPEEQIDYEIALVTDAGLIMNGGYSQVAWEAITEFGSSTGVSHKYYKASEASDKAYKETIDNAVANGAGIIIADGYSFEDVVYNAQKKYEDVKFILIDAEPVDKDSGETKIAGNTAAIHFASEQAGYLAGYAAVFNGASQLGFIGAEKQPAVMDYGYGFLQGADAAAQENAETVTVRYYYCTSDDDRDAVLDKASSWYKGSTEVIFACGASVEQPVVEAAEFDGKSVIASETAKSQMSDTVITSAVKNISDALEETLKLYKNDQFPGGQEIIYNATNDGISLDMENSRMDGFSKGEYKRVLGDIKDGEIIVKKHDDGKISSLGLTNVRVISK